MVLVKCIRCKKEKDSTFDFGWTKNDLRQKYCKECSNNYAKQWYHKKKNKNIVKTA